MKGFSTSQTENVSFFNVVTSDFTLLELLEYIKNRDGGAVG